MNNTRIGPKTWGLTGETAFLDVVIHHDAKRRDPNRCAEHRFVADGMGSRPPHKRGDR